MEEYLNRPIKKIVTAFPKVGEILEEYNIGCIPCNVGSCLLKDIVEIHNLSEEAERGLLEKIARVIYPGKDVKIPKIKRKSPTLGEIKYSPPIKRLVDEHVQIKRLVGLIPKITAKLDIESEEGRTLVHDCVNFIRNYADKYHHAKEEEILFKYFDENLDILKVIHQDHESARGHARSILDALDKRDRDAVMCHLNAYYDLLTEHIKKEDEILYPWMDRNLSISQIGELFAKFNEAEDKGDKEVIRRCRRFVGELEARFKDSKEAEVAR